MQFFFILQGEFSLCNALGVQFCQPFHTGINIGDSIPRCFVHRSGWREVENLLKFQYGFLCQIAETARNFTNFRNRRIITADAVQLDLQQANIFPTVSQCQRKTGIGLRGRLHRNILHQVDGIPIIIRQNIIGRIPLLCQSNRSPLRQPLTSDCRSITERCKQRLDCSLSANIGVQLFVY